MDYTKEEYENFINGSFLLSLSPDTDSVEYKKEKYQFLTHLAEYFSKFVYSEEKFRHIGEEFILAAQDSLKGFDPKKSSDPLNPDFIHYFSRVLKNRVKKSRISDMAEDKRGGIVIPMEGLVNKVRRNADYLLSQQKDPYSEESVCKIAELCRCSVKKVRECYKIITDTTTKQIKAKNSDGETVSIFHLIDSGVYADDKLIAKDNFNELFCKIDTIYASLQNRESQRRLFSMWITVYLIEISGKENRDFSRRLAGKDYFSKQVAAFYLKKSRNPTKGEIAELCGVTPQSASRTFRMFEEKMRVLFRKT